MQIMSAMQDLITSLNQIIVMTTINAKILTWIVAVIWGVFFITSMEKRVLYLGIIPRRVYGLPGIICSPFLHANFNHVFFNTIPLVVLSNFLLMNGIDYYVTITVSITVLSGLLIWCFAQPGLYIGASAVITGYWGVLVLNIYQEGTTTAIILGLVSLYYFAGILYGLFPGAKGVSWQGHLFGLIAGLITGYWIH